MFQDDNVGWDPIHLYRPVGIIAQIYVLFVLVVMGVAIAKLLRVWGAALPFRLSRQTGNPQYLRLLEEIQSSLQQWITCAFITGGLVFSTNLTQLCDRLLLSKAINETAVIYGIMDLSIIMSIALVSMFFLFLVRWHSLCRAEYLRRRVTPP